MTQNVASAATVRLAEGKKRAPYIRSRDQLATPFKNKRLGRPVFQKKADRISFQNQVQSTETFQQSPEIKSRRVEDVDALSLVHATVL